VVDGEVLELQGEDREVSLKPNSSRRAFFARLIRRLFINPVETSFLIARRLDLSTCTSTLVRHLLSVLARVLELFLSRTDCFSSFPSRTLQPLSTTPPWNRRLFSPPSLRERSTSLRLNPRFHLRSRSAGSLDAGRPSSRRDRAEALGSR